MKFKSIFRKIFSNENLFSAKNDLENIVKILDRVDDLNKSLYYNKADLDKSHYAVVKNQRRKAS